MMVHTTARYGAVTALAIFLFSGCAVFNSPPDIRGVWFRIDDTNRSRLCMNFKENQAYMIGIVSNNDFYDGEYSISGDTLYLTDKFCGTKLMGRYRIAVADTSMTLSIIGDQYCGRKDYLPGIWVRSGTTRMAANR